MALRKKRERGRGVRKGEKRGGGGGEGRQDGGGEGGEEERGGGGRGGGGGEGGEGEGGGAGGEGWDVRWGEEVGLRRDIFSNSSDRLSHGRPVATRIPRRHR